MGVQALSQGPRHLAGREMWRIPGAARGPLSSWLAGWVIAAS